MRTRAPGLHLAGPAGKRQQAGAQQEGANPALELVKSNSSNSAVDLEKVELHTGNKFAA